MIDRLWKGPERRRHPRIEACVQIALGVEVYGFEAGARPFFTRGVTCNVSLGGVLARLDAPVSPGSICNVFFRQAGDEIRPHHLAGRVLHCRREGDDYLVGVRFDEPLLKLDLAAGDLTESLQGSAAGTTVANR